MYALIIDGTFQVDTQYCLPQATESTNVINLPSFMRGTSFFALLSKQHTTKNERTGNDTHHIIVILQKGRDVVQSIVSSRKVLYVVGSNDRNGQFPDYVYTHPS